MKILCNKLFNPLFIFVFTLGSTISCFYLATGNHLMYNSPGRCSVTSECKSTRFVPGSTQGSRRSKRSDRSQWRFSLCCKLRVWSTTKGSRTRLWWHRSRWCFPTWGQFWKKRDVDASPVVKSPKKSNFGSMTKVQFDKTMCTSIYLVNVRAHCQAVKFVPHLQYFT